MRNSSAGLKFDQPSQSIAETLDIFLDRLTAETAFDLVEKLIVELGTFYDVAAKHGTLEAFRAQCQVHPLHRLVCQDPFTERAFSKPRGYAGDAVRFA